MKPAKQEHTHGQILKSSALIGGSSAFNIVVGIVRTKALAELLGAAGFGLLGVFTAIMDLTRTVAEMGINSSGVRQVAEAVGTNDSARVARTVATLRRITYLLGIVGALLLLSLCVPVAWFSFEDTQNAGQIALLAVAVLFGTVHSGQAALVQGARRIGDLAKLNALGALLGAILSIPVVWFLGERGTVPALICITGASATVSWWYSRKVTTERVSLTASQMAAEAAGLLKLGIAFMTAGMMTLGAAYLIRTMVWKGLNAEAAGYYQAAWTLAGLYITFILQAMGADFFPRLTAVARDKETMNRLVNEQSEVSLLLAGPGIAGTLTFAPIVVHLFYSSSFAPAVELLRWMCLGMLLRVCSWPLGFVLLARGERFLYFVSEVSTHLLHLGLVWFGLRFFGLRGVGMAFFGVYVFYWCLTFVIARRLIGFRLSSTHLQNLFWIVLCVGVVFASSYVLPSPFALGVGAIVTAASGIYALRTMCHLVPLGRVPRFAQRLLALLRISPAPVVKTSAT